MKNIDQHLLNSFKNDDKFFERERLRYLASGAIQKLMGVNGIDNKQLATLSGKWQFVINNFLSKRKTVTIDSLSDIALALGYQVNIFFRKRSNISEQEFIHSLDHNNSIIDAPNKSVRINLTLNVTVHICKETPASGSCHLGAHQKRTLIDDLHSEGAFVFSSSLEQRGRLRLVESSGIHH